MIESNSRINNTIYIVITVHKYVLDVDKQATYEQLLFLRKITDSFWIKHGTGLEHTFIDKHEATNAIEEFKSKNKVEISFRWWPD